MPMRMKEICTALFLSVPHTFLFQITFYPYIFEIGKCVGFISNKTLGDFPPTDFS